MRFLIATWPRLVQAAHDRATGATSTAERVAGFLFVLGLLYRVVLVGVWVTPADSGGCLKVLDGVTGGGDETC